MNKRSQLASVEWYEFDKGAHTVEENIRKRVALQAQVDDSFWEPSTAYGVYSMEVASED